MAQALGVLGDETAWRPAPQMQGLSLIRGIWFAYGLPLTFKSWEIAGLQTWRWFASLRSTFLLARA